MPRFRPRAGRLLHPRPPLGPAGLPLAAAGPAAQPSPSAALLDTYCLSCHNTRVRAAGLMLDEASRADVGANAEVWEKVVRKLRAGAMPPVGRPRPDAAAVSGFVSTLETALDRAAADEAESGTRRRSPLEPERVRECRPGPSGARDRRPRAAARRQFRSRIRQHRGRPVRLAGAPRSVLLCRAQDQPAGDRTADDDRFGDAPAGERLAPGRSDERGPAVRIGRRRRPAVSISR